MARILPVEFHEKRTVLYGKGQEKAQARVAAEFLAAGRLAEALEFLERLRDRDLLGRTRAEAVRRGDAFALGRAAQLLGESPEPSEWRSLATAAEGAGKWYDAIRALEKAGDEEAAEALRAEHHPDYRPFRPAGK